MPNVPVLGTAPTTNLPVHPQGIRATDQQANAPSSYPQYNPIPISNPQYNPIPISNPAVSPVINSHIANFDNFKHVQGPPNNVATAPHHDPFAPNNLSATPNPKCMIKIVSIQNLPKKIGAFDRTDPIIELTTPTNSYRTKVMKNAGSEATFNEVTTLTLASDRTVTIKVFDFNHIQKDTLLCTGSCVVPQAFEPNHILKVNLKHANQQTQTALGDAIATIELLGSNV